MRGGGSSEENEDEGDGRLFKQIMVQCLAENWDSKDGKMVMRKCFNCFKNVTREEDQTEALNMGKTCTATYLKRANKVTFKLNDDIFIF